MREKELRLALVCYGGVSLAVYMHGITKEVWKLLRASRAFHTRGDDGAELSDSEQVYLQLLREIAPHQSLRVVTDIIAGASAGGINGIFLAQAIIHGHSLEPLRDLWLENADVERLLDPDAAPQTAWSKAFAQPLIWYLSRNRAEATEQATDPAARTELYAKLSRFIRSRWFEPPFSGVGFTRLLYDALLAMESEGSGEPLLPPEHPLDLFVTVTDFSGYPERIRINSPREIVETEHRLVISFHSDGHGPRQLGAKPELAFAARATASFPGAFPPFQVGEIDQVVAEIGDEWLGRAAFLSRVFPHHVQAGLDPAGAALIDGAVLNNAPFGPAIQALKARPAHREVDRRFVYIDPKPNAHFITMPSGQAGEPPGFFTTILRSMSDIPRQQPIRDDLEAIEAMSRRVRRLRHVVAGMRDEVDRAIERALGRTLFLYRLTPRRLAGWRAAAHVAAAQGSGYAYAAYGELKLSQVVDSLGDLLIELGRLDERENGVKRVRHLLWESMYVTGAHQVISPARNRLNSTHPYVTFLRRYDLGFRTRRLRFLIRRLTELIPNPPPGQDVRALDALKSELYELLAPFVERRSPDFFSVAATELAGRADSDPASALAILGDEMDLTELDAKTDVRLVELLNDSLVQPVRRSLLMAYLGFPFFDIATLPLLQGEGLDEFDEIKVDRIAPEDAASLRGGSAETTLKGIQFNAFGAFFSRAYRENDYLWGRLHGAERLIDIVLSTLPPEATLPHETACKFKQRAFRAILDAERPHLAAIPDLVANLDREIASIGGKSVVQPDLSTAPSTALSPSI